MGEGGQGFLGVQGGEEEGDREREGERRVGLWNFEVGRGFCFFEGGSGERGGGLMEEEDCLERRWEKV